MFTIRSGKYYWCDATDKWRAGWANLDSTPKAIDIWTTLDKPACRRKIKHLKAKYCRTYFRLYEVKDSRRLQLLTFNKLKQNVRT